MSSLRSEEEWARQMISRALGVPVVQRDDGSLDGMHDLDVLHPDQRRAAVEVTAAADGQSIALWKLMNGRDERWIVPNLEGGWMVGLDPSARGKRVRTELPELLMALERSGIKELRRWDSLPSDGSAAVAHAMGIVTAGQHLTSFPGSIYVTLELPSERTGGLVADTGDALAAWLPTFLGDPDRSDVLRKLARSGAARRHAFVFLPASPPLRSRSPICSCAMVLPCRPSTPSSPTR